MKRIAFLLYALALMISAKAQTLNVNVGQVTYSYKSSQTGDMTYDGNTLTILGKTYNTADNSMNQMWLDDNGEFWAFKMKVDVDYQARTFSCPEKDYDADGTGTAVVTGGKILEGAAKNLHGMPNDSIVFNIKFSDDDDNNTFRLSGQRYTGFYE